MPAVRSPSRSFPPYQLIERDFLDEAEAKFSRLSRIYDVSQRHSWDGKKVLAALLEEHGGIHLAHEKKEALAQIFTVILWGELAAWNIAADIAEQLENVDAKMAASSQVFDEARHFYTMRAYLMELDVELPPLNGYTRTVLVELLETTSVEEKLIGMQLLVENIAVHLFRAVAESGAEPVLAGLLPYFVRDEARHVGLGVLYLPELLKPIGRVESARLQLFQIKITSLVFWSTLLLRDAFATLGIDLHKTYKDGIRSQYEIFDSMGATTKGVNGVYVPRGILEKLNHYAVELYFPRKGIEPPGWMRFFHKGAQRIANAGDTFLGWTT